MELYQALRRRRKLRLHSNYGRWQMLGSLAFLAAAPLAGAALFRFNERAAVRVSVGSTD